MKIGIVPGSFKPYHAGHDAIVRLAAQENDKVYVLASLSDRDEIKGSVMKTVWKEIIIPSLPGNVNVKFPKKGGQPVGMVYDFISKTEEQKNDDVVSIYSDDADVVANYTDKRLSKAAPKMFKKNKINRRGISRSSTVNISGTKMRDFLTSGNKKSFIKHLPQAIDREGMWTLLKNNLDECLIKEYVELTIL